MHGRVALDVEHVDQVQQAERVQLANHLARRKGGVWGRQRCGRGGGVGEGRVGTMRWWRRDGRRGWKGRQRGEEETLEATYMKLITLNILWWRVGNLRVSRSDGKRTAA